MLQKLDALGRLIKWAVELSRLDVVFKGRIPVKGQALVDFVIEFTLIPKMEEEMKLAKPPTWSLFVDGSSKDIGSGVGVVLVSPEGHKLNCAIRFGFKATNIQ